MCGFLVYIPIQKKKYDKDLLINSSKSLSHRGPDTDSFFITNNGSFFYHYRLSIIDNSHLSNQPFISKCKRYVLCFNGEIYNYKFLINKFVSKEIIRGDTQLLMYLLINYSTENFLNEIEGMFSFVFFDIYTNKFIAARDRFGIKPLYYLLNNDEAFFCSEPHPIADIKEFKFDNISLKEIEKFRRPTPGYSFYKNVLECLPGYFISNKSFQRWNGSLPEISSEEFKQEELVERIKKVFSLNTVGDICHTAFQSGGIDSTLVSLFTKPDKLYTVGIKGDNEIEQSIKIAQFLNLDIKSCEIDEKNFFSTLKDYLKIKKEPISVPNEVLIFNLCRNMDTSHKFFITGEGADEIFFGYDRIFKWAFSNKKRNNIFIKEFFEKYSYSKTNFISDRFWEYCINLYKNSNNNLDFVEDFFLNFHLPGLLARVDRAAMAAGKESRVPFCSQTILNYMYRRSFQIRIKEDKAKYPLREIIRENGLSFILETPKIGFRALLPGSDTIDTYRNMLIFYKDNFML